LWLWSVCVRVQKFGSEIFVWWGVVQELDYFKKFLVFVFFNPWHPPKNAQNEMRFGGKDFLNSGCSYLPESFKTFCSRQSGGAKLLPPKLIFDNNMHRRGWGGHETPSKLPDRGMVGY
jgi:hypothetical protein